MAWYHSIPLIGRFLPGGTEPLDGRTASIYADSPTPAPVYSGVEIIEKRTRSSKVHSLGENRYSVDAVIGSLHYKDDISNPAEQWKDIDNTLVDSVAPWDWEMTKAGYHARFLGDFTAGQIVEFEKQGEYVRFQPMALQWSNDLDQIQPIGMPATPSSVYTIDDRIVWLDAYGEGKDFAWKCNPSRLVKLLIIDQLNRLPTPEQYIMDGGNPVLELNLIFDPSRDLDCYVDGQLWDKKSKVSTFGICEWKLDGETLFGFMPNLYWDNEENYPEQPALTTLKKVGGSLYVTVRIPYSWLQTAVFPVYIDVIVDEQVAAGADDGGDTTSGGGAFDNNDATDDVGTWYGAEYRQFWRWDGITIEGTIDTSYVQVKISNAGSQPLPTKVYGIDEADSDAPSDHATFLTDCGLHTTAGVDWDIDGESAGTWIQSPSLNTIFQELVDTHTISNAAVQLHWHDDGGTNKYLYIYMYETAGNVSGPKLHIEYTAGGGGGLSIPIAMGHYRMLRSQNEDG